MTLRDACFIFSLRNKTIFHFSGIVYYFSFLYFFPTYLSRKLQIKQMVKVLSRTYLHFSSLTVNINNMNLKIMPHNLNSAVRMLTCPSSWYFTISSPHCLPMHNQNKSKQNKQTRTTRKQQQQQKQNSLKFGKRFGKEVTFMLK